MHSSKIKATPLGGVGEIGALNCMVYETDDSAVIVDCGTMFPNEETLGVDLVIPDFTYLREIRKKLKGVILTHGHEDHIGAVPFLLREFNLPVYGSAFTLGLIRQKILEYPLPKTPKTHLFEPGDKINVGSFEIDTIFVNHSVIGASAFAFRTAGGAIVHLTDWKIDHSPIDGRTIDLKKISRIGKDGVLALFSDSTNIYCPGKTLSEREVSAKIRKICATHKGRIIATLFSSNIHRVQALANIAKSLGRSLSLVGRSMHENTEIARSLGQLSFDGVNLVDVEETRSLKPEKVMLLVTGTQGEPRSVLSRMAVGEFKPFQIQKGDLVLFSAKVIPGNEKNIYYMINHLWRHGAHVLYETVKDVHTSGHAHQDELELIIRKLKPKFFVPIHGEYRHLMKHAELASNWGVKSGNIFIIENGNPVIFDKKGAFAGDRVSSGRVFVDGRGVGDVSDVVIRDRRHLSDTGIVICVIAIDRQNGDILHGPELTSRGFIVEEENRGLFDKAKKGIVELLNSFNFETRTDFAEVQEEVRLNLRRLFKKELDRKPVVIPIIQEV